MKKNFGSKKPRPFGSGSKNFPGSKPGFKPRKRFDEEGPGGRDDSSKPAWKKKPFNKPGQWQKSSDDKPAWKSDRPALKSEGGPGRTADGRPAWKPGSAPGWKKDKPSWKPGEKPAWKSDSKPGWQKDKPSWKPGGKPDWKKDKPAWKQAGDRPEWKPGGDRPAWKSDSKPGGDRPAWKSDRPAWKSDGKPDWKKDKPDWKKDKPDWKKDKPAWKKDKPEWNREPREQRADDFEHQRNAVSVPSNKKNFYDARPAAPGRKPFSARIPDGSPYCKSLLVTLEDTNNVPVRLVWIYESMVGDLPDGEPRPGDTVYVHDQNQRFVGSAIYNPHSRIRARIFSLARQRFDEEYIRQALRAAVDRRRRMGMMESSCRVVFGESDGLPGLTADKIGDYLVVQPLTFAVNRYLDFIVDELNGLVGPEGIVVRLDVPIRAKEGLTVDEPIIHGDIPERVKVTESDCVLYADVSGGQKTGLFLDQRFNREVMKPFAQGARVLDLFCHVGGWALAAAHYGASEVVGIDSSKPALELARAGAEEMGVENVTFFEGDVFDFLGAEGPEDDAPYDIIIVDPPAFAKTRQHYEEAFRAYLSLNYRAMKKLKPGGLLVTCSCSQAVSATEFNEAILTAARNARMQFQVIERRGAPADHPVLLGLPETEYLKCQVMLRTE